MAKYSITAIAEDDLQEIFDYIAQDNIQSASKLHANFLETFRKIAQMPQIGRLREEFGKEIRSLALKNYVIFYVEASSKVIISRVLHGARNIQSDFF